MTSYSSCACYTLGILRCPKHGSSSSAVPAQGTQANADEKGVPASPPLRDREGPLSSKDCAGQPCSPDTGWICDAHLEPMARQSQTATQERDGWFCEGCRGFWQDLAHWKLHTCCAPTATCSNCEKPRDSHAGWCGIGQEAPAVEQPCRCDANQICGKHQGEVFKGIQELKAKQARPRNVDGGECPEGECYANAYFEGAGEWEERALKAEEALVESKETLWRIVNNCTTDPQTLRDLAAWVLKHGGFAHVTRPAREGEKS